jgi:hypothetical protein
MITRRGCALLASIVIGAGCASAPEEEAGSPPDEAARTATLQEVRAEIDQAIGEARASATSECALVALGERPCGGPRTYLAYSLVETDSAHLATLAALYARIDRERNTELGLVSTCEFLAAPEVVVENGRCATQ